MVFKSRLPFIQSPCSLPPLLLSCIKLATINKASEIGLLLVYRNQRRVSFSGWETLGGDWWDVLAAAVISLWRRQTVGGGGGPDVPQWYLFGLFSSSVLCSPPQAQFAGLQVFYLKCPIYCACLSRMPLVLALICTWGRGCLLQNEQSLYVQLSISLFH